MSGRKLKKPKKPKKSGKAHGDAIVVAKGSADLLIRRSADPAAYDTEELEDFATEKRLSRGLTFVCSRCGRTVSNLEPGWGLAIFCRCDGTFFVGRKRDRHELRGGAIMWTGRPPRVPPPLRAREAPQLGEPLLLLEAETGKVER